MLQGGHDVSEGAGVCEPGRDTVLCWCQMMELYVHQFESSGSARFQTSFLCRNTGRINLWQILMRRIHKDGHTATTKQLSSLWLCKAGIFPCTCGDAMITFKWAFVSVFHWLLCSLHLRARDLTAFSVVSFQDNHPLASLPLLGYSLTIPSESENIHKDHVFKLHFKSHVYYFRAESEYTFER